VCLQMLVREICLITAFVGADIGPLVRMRSKMRCQSRRPVESLGAAFPGTFDGFQLGWKLLSARGERSDRSVGCPVFIGRVRIIFFLYSSSLSSSSNFKDPFPVLLSNTGRLGSGSGDSTSFLTRSLFVDSSNLLAAFLFFAIVAILEHFQG